MKTLKKVSALLLALLCLAGCGGGTRSLTGQVRPAPVGADLKEEDAAALAEFSLDLLKETWKGENALTSPLSVLCALGMTANGARGETLEQMEAVLDLVNALALEAEWEEIYEDIQVREDAIFTKEDGAEQPAALMYSSEGYYLKDEGAQGFLKFYKGGRWAFAALLPDEGTALEDYLNSLTGARLRQVLAGAEETLVYAAIPKFKSAYGVELNDALKSLGMTDAFDMGRADLSGLGVSEMGPLFISRVLHKTYISVDEKGTQAGAATAVLADSGGTAPGNVPEVYLERPFLYMLVDTETSLPAFIGVVTAME